MGSAHAPRPAKLVIFVDANALLELYEHFDPVVTEIPAKLHAAADSLLMTRQVADEVERGKLRVAQKGIDRVLASLRVPPAGLPVGLQANSVALRSSINTLTEVIEKIRTAAHAHIRDVATSTDPLSQGLAPLFEQAEEPTQEVLARARDRHERGNPPGNPRDPLGDQLNWEQLLERVEGATILWLVTGDADFGPGKGAGKPASHLNPLLRQDLERRAPGLEIRVHGKEPQDLVRGLNDYFKEHGQAEERFSDEQLAHFERLADEADSRREPGECRQCGSQTPIESAYCAKCEEELEGACGEEAYSVQRVEDGHEIDFISEETSTPARCENCGSGTFEIEFASLCSGCQHFLHRAMED